MCVGPVAKWPAGARGDPAAERRELERLRVEAQRQPVLARAAPRAAGRSRRPGCARRARRVDLEHAVQRAEVERTAPAWPGPGTASTPPTTLVPPPNGDRPRRRASAHHVEHARELVLVARARDDVGRVRELARGTPRTTSR